MPPCRPDEAAWGKPDELQLKALHNRRRNTRQPIEQSSTKSSLTRARTRPRTLKSVSLVSPMRSGALAPRRGFPVDTNRRFLTHSRKGHTDGWQEAPGVWPRTKRCSSQLATETPPSQAKCKRSKSSPESPQAEAAELINSATPLRVVGNQRPKQA
jgi:hypothetical protein